MFNTTFVGTGGLAPAVMNALNLKCGGSKPPPYKGYGLCPMCLCNTKAKLAIKR